MHINLLVAFSSEASSICNVKLFRGLILFWLLSQTPASDQTVCQMQAVSHRKVVAFIGLVLQHAMFMF